MDTQALQMKLLPFYSHRVKIFYWYLLLQIHYVQDDFGKKTTKYGDVKHENCENNWEGNNCNVQQINDYGLKLAWTPFTAFIGLHNNTQWHKSCEIMPFWELLIGYFDSFHPIAVPALSGAVHRTVLKLRSITRSCQRTRPSGFGKNSKYLPFIATYSIATAKCDHRHRCCSVLCRVSSVKLAINRWLVTVLHLLLAWSGLKRNTVLMETTAFGVPGRLHRPVIRHYVLSFEVYCQLKVLIP